MPKIAQAIAAYERTVLSGNSPYDRYQAGDKDALSPAAVRGLEIFNEEIFMRDVYTHLLTNLGISKAELRGPRVKKSMAI